MQKRDLLEVSFNLIQILDYFLRFFAGAALTFSFKPLPALNAGDLEALIVIVFPF